MTEFSFDTRDGNLNAEDLADSLEFIAGQLREGYLTGDAQGAGWWTVANLKDDVFYQVTTEDGLLQIIDDVDPFKPVAESWDVSAEAETFMEDLAEKLNDQTLDPDTVRLRVRDRLEQVRVNRLGYSWTDDWATGQQRWTLTGPKGEVRLPSGGFHGYSECIEVANRDADRLGLASAPAE